MQYDFSLVISGSTELTEELSDRLFQIAPDCSPGVCSEVMSIDFHRTADSLEQAIRSAIADVQATGLTAERAEISATTLK